MTFYRSHHAEFKDLFSIIDGLVFCIDVHSVMETLVHEYDTDEWHLFIDSSKVSFKAVLLHNGNKFPSVPLTHTTNMNNHTITLSF